MSDDAPGARPPPLRRVLLLGSAWMIGLKWTIKFAGLINTMILARLLTPADFGLVAMAAAVVGLATVFFEFGVDHALIQTTNATRHHYDAAWTIRLAQSVGVALVVCAAAPFAAAHFEDDRVLPVLFILAGSIVVKGLGNIGIVDFRKELRFGTEFRYVLACRFATIALTIAVALWLRTYWALVIGIVAGELIQTVSSYFVHSFRPRLSLSEGRSIWSFSKWLIVSQLGLYAAYRVDRALLGGITDAQDLGYYTLGEEFAEIPSAQIAGSLSRALTPGFAKLKTVPARLNDAFVKSFAATAMLGVPAAVGIGAVANELVPIALGDQWLPVAPLLEILAIYGLARCLMSTSQNLLMVTGHMRTIAIVAIAHAVLFLGLLYPAFQWYGIIGVAALKAATTLLAAASSIAIACWSREIPVHRIFVGLWRSLTGAAVMGLLLLWLDGHGPASAYADLLLEVTAGAAVYAASVLLLWLAAGRPRGVESDILELVTRKLGIGPRKPS